jgi:mono/diheme cytochrome c family protein
MKVGLALVATVGMAAVGIAQQDATTPETRSVWDGVYTEEQATRGAAVYEQECSSCHGEDLAGRDEAPPLSGALFTGNWDGLTVGDLFDRIRVSMPQGDPGRLSRQQIADVLAHLLRFNQFPAGEAELARQTEFLKQIRFEATKPETK